MAWWWGRWLGGGAFLVGGGSVCDDMGCVSTGDEVMLTSPPELAHCGGGSQAQFEMVQTRTYLADPGEHRGCSKKLLRN